MFLETRFERYSCLRCVRQSGCLGTSAMSSKVVSTLGAADGLPVVALEISRDLLGPARAFGSWLVGQAVGTV